MNQPNVISIDSVKNAIKTGDSLRIKHLLSNGMDVNVRFCIESSSERNDFTFLHYAVWESQKDIVKLLLEHEADVGAKDSLGRTPLHLACGIPEVLGDIVKSLQRNISIASENYPQYCTDAAKRSLGIVWLLVNHGSCVNAVDHNGETPLFHIFHDDWSKIDRLSLNSVHGLSFKFHFRRTKLATVEKLRHLQYKKIKILLKYKANADTLLSNTLDTILHRAVIHLEPSRDLQQFARPFFADKTHAAIVEAILNHDIVCDVNARNALGETPLSIAASLLSADIVRILVNRGADIKEAKLKDFRYPCVLPCLEAVENLLSIIDIREENECPLSPNESLEVMKFLLFNNEVCHYVDSDYEIASYKLENLLHYGTENNIIKTLERISMDTRHSREIISCQIKTYLMKLTASKLRISERLKDYLQSRIFKDSTSTADIVLNEYQLEVDKMRYVVFNNGKSLIKMLKAPVDRFDSFYQKRVYGKFHKLKSCKKDFARFLGIIDGIFAKNLVRLLIKKINNKFFISLTMVSTKSLPECCLEIVHSYLSNEDFFNVFLSFTRR